MINRPLFRDDVAVLPQPVNWPLVLLKCVYIVLGNNTGKLDKMYRINAKLTIYFFIFDDLLNLFFFKCWDSLKTKINK